MRKNIAIFVMVFASLILLFSAIAECVLPEITKIRPKKYHPGQKAELIVYGWGSAQFPDDVQIDLGEGITISSVGSASPWVFRSIKAAIVISETASLGFRNLRISSQEEDESIVITDAVEIVDKSSLPVSFNTKSSDIFRIVRSPTSIAVDDIDNDGDIDVAIGSRIIALFKNSGSGELELYKSFDTKMGDVLSIVFGDFNGDKRKDFASVYPGHPDEGEGYVSLFYGRKNGKFKKKVKNFSTLTMPSELATGDFNEDGIDDIVVANNGVWQNKGNIAIFFEIKNKRAFKRKIIKAGKRPKGIRVCDINKDGNQDIIYFADKGDSLFVLLGNGKGKFRKKINKGLDFNVYAKIVDIRNYDNDKKLDLLVRNADFSTTGRNIVVLRGNGKGKFKRLTKLKDLAFNFLDDFNNDGIEDIITSHDGKKFGTFIKMGQSPFSVSDAIEFSHIGLGLAKVADLNGDGYLDIVSAGYDFSVLLNTTNK